MKRCPNTAIKTCKARTHADDALYCHLCGAKLVESIEEKKQNTTNPNSGSYSHGGYSSASTSPTSSHSGTDNDVDHSKMIKWIIAIMVIIGVIALIITFWQQIVHFIGAVFVIIIILAVLVSSN